MSSRADGCLGRRPLEDVVGTEAELALGTEAEVALGTEAESSPLGSVEVPFCRLRRVCFRRRRGDLDDVSESAGDEPTTVVTERGEVEAAVEGVLETAAWIARSVGDVAVTCGVGEAGVPEEDVPEEEDEVAGVVLAE